MDKKQVSKIMTRTSNAPRKIKSCFGKKSYNENDYFDFFRKKVFGKFDSNLIEIKSKAFYVNLYNSNLVSLPIKQRLSIAIEENDFSVFLSIALVLALTSFPNKTQQKSDDELELELANKSTLERESPLRKTIPSEIQENENLYITAIVDAISEKDRHSYSLDELKNDQKYGKKLERHRNEFYSAEYVRRQSREIFDENEDPFDELQDELMDGIYYTVNKDYNDGYERLTSSLEQAAQVSIESNPLIKETDVVSMKAKQGLCHTLVNDKKLDGWTNDKYI